MQPIKSHINTQEVRRGKEGINRIQEAKINRKVHAQASALDPQPTQTD
jgi:hypothetical protein